MDELERGERGGNRKVLHVVVVVVGVVVVDFVLIRLHALIRSLFYSAQYR